jgi:hypothetical protein
MPAGKIEGLAGVLWRQRRYAKGAEWPSKT